jgi:hypothetical protein
MSLADAGRGYTMPGIDDAANAGIMASSKMAHNLILTNHIVPSREVVILFIITASEWTATLLSGAASVTVFYRLFTKLKSNLTT